MYKYVLSMLYGFCLIVTYGPAFSYETISIDISTDVKVDIKTDNHMLGGTVTVQNHGNVAARNVHAEIRVMGETVITQVVETIGPGQLAMFHVEKELGAIQKGSYPFVITVYFYDSKLYPFSAVSCTQFMVKGNRKNTDIICTAHDFDIQKQGNLRITMKNTGNIIQNMKASLIIPHEFVLPAACFDFEMEPGQEKEMNIHISNLKAIAGAVYPVFCVVEYDDSIDGSHNTLISKADITISKKENWFRKTRWNWLAAGLFFLLIYGAVTIWCTKIFLSGTQQKSERAVILTV